MFLAKAIEPGVLGATSAIMPGFMIETETFGLGLLITVLAGLVAGILPALATRNLTVIAALGARD